METIAPPLGAWENFYVIIGSAAAALTGLQFVVIVLSAEINALGSGAASSTFGTPTIVHFCAVLFISAILSAPWPALASAGIVLGGGGVVAFLYTAMVIRNVRRQTDYAPVLEDWIWHCVLPLMAYAVVLVAAIFLQGASTLSLFAIGAMALLLLFIGIHNAWDSVLYIALKRRQQSAPED
jgi:hypothetical protein